MEPFSRLPMTTAHTFTDTKLKSLKPKSTQYELSDEGQRALRIRVSPGGTKSWFLITRIRGVKRRLKIGTYPEISLTAARERSRNQLAEIQLGKDLWSEKKGRSNHIKFEEFAERYLREQGSQKSDQGREDRRKAEKHLLPFWRKLNVDEITKRHVHTVIDSMMNGGQTYTMPNRVLQLIKTMFNWGVEKDYISVNPAERIKKPVKEKHREVYLLPNEIRLLWIALSDEPPIFGNFFKLCILMGQRSGSEMRGLKWSEIDFDRKLAVISYQRMKNRSSQEVPLSKEALTLLREQKNQAGESLFVFPSPVNPIACPMSYPRKRFAAIKRRSAIEKDFHVHDFRHTIATLMISQLKVPKNVTEKIISHKERKEMADIYDQHTYADEKRDALEKWGSFISEIVKSK